MSKTPPQPQSDGVSTLHACSPLLEKLLIPRFRDSAGGSFHEEGGNDGRVTLRLGCSVRGQNSEREMARLAAEHAHKLPGTVNSASSIETFCAAFAEPPRSDQIRQHNHGGIYKSPRGLTLSSASQSGTETDCVGQETLSFITGNARPGNNECGGGSPVQGESSYGEWTLHSQVVGQLWKRFGRTAVDLFALHENSHCHLFFSQARDGTPMGVDALAHPWPNIQLYAFPLLSLIIPTLRRVRECGHSVILIAPNWPGKLWLAEIMQLLVNQPWPLPLRRDFLSQARREIFYPALDKVALWAWPVRG